MSPRALENYMKLKYFQERSPPLHPLVHLTFLLATKRSKIISVVTARTTLSFESKITNIIVMCSLGGKFFFGASFEGGVSPAQLSTTGSF